MKINLPIIMIFGAGLALAVSGCSRKPDAKTELEKAVSALSTTEPAPAAPPRSEVLLEEIRDLLAARGT